MGIAFAYHSGKIENAKDANELFLKAFDEWRSLDEKFIKTLQKCLTQNTYDTRGW